MILVFMPLEPRGVQLAVCDGSTMQKIVTIEHSDDIVAAAKKIILGCSVTGILVRSGIGSFSAGRSSYVVATVLSALRNVPVRFSSDDLLNPTAIQNAWTNAKRQFSYAAPPHIT